MTAGPANVPPVADVVAHFRRALGAPAPSPPRGVLELLLGLHENNALQWACEDVSRRDDADDHTIANAKREIDALNGKRHVFVEAIDAALTAVIDQSPSAPPTTESPGMVYDRLSVLVIRLASTESAARADRADRDVFAARLPALHEQLASLEAALQALFDDVQAGRKRFVPYQGFKLYEGPGSRGGDSRPD